MKRINAKSTFAITGLFILLTLTFTGCLGYNLGTTLPHNIESVHVPTFKNKTSEPLLEVSTTDATIGQFQFDGSLKIAEEDSADAILNVTLTSYHLTPLSFDREKNTKTREYRATVYAHVTLISRSTDEVILDAPSVIGEATFYLSGDMTTSKNRAVPELSEDLARHIVDTVTQTW